MGRVRGGGGGWGGGGWVLWLFPFRAIWRFFLVLVFFGVRESIDRPSCFWKKNGKIQFWFFVSFLCVSCNLSLPAFCTSYILSVCVAVVVV